MKAVTATIRDAFGSVLPLLVILVVGLLVMPIAQWGTGQSGFMSGIILGVLLQTTIGVLFLAQAAGMRRVVGIVLIVLRWRGRPNSSAPQPRPVRRVRLYQQASAATAGRAAAGPAGVADDAAAGVGRRTADHRPCFRRGLRRGQRVGVHRVGSLSRSADGALGAVGLGRGGPYFGIPLANFAGWLLISALITALARPPALPQTPLDRHLRPGLAHRGGRPGVRLGAAGPALCRLLAWGYSCCWRGGGGELQTANCKLRIADSSFAIC